MASLADFLMTYDYHQWLLETLREPAIADALQHAIDEHGTVQASLASPSTGSVISPLCASMALKADGSGYQVFRSAGLEHPGNLIHLRWRKLWDGRPVSYCGKTFAIGDEMVQDEFSMTTCGKCQDEWEKEHGVSQDENEEEECCPVCGEPY